MIYRYEPTPEMDLAVAGMWSRMRAEGDLAATFPRDGQALSDLYRMLSGVNRGMFFEADETGIWVAVWYEQVMGVLYIGVWAARGRRSKRLLRTLLTIFDKGLAAFPAMLAVTKQPRIVHLFRSFGAEVLGAVPGMWDGETAWLMMLTPAGFLRANARRLAALRLEPEVAEASG